MAKPSGASAAEKAQAAADKQAKADAAKKPKKAPAPKKETQNGKLTGKNGQKRNYASNGLAGQEGTDTKSKAS
jgi:hypothetical protein